jgi:putative ABC transport system ATP-binding protein
MEITTSDLGLVARVANLTKSYGTGSTTVTALNDVSIGIRKGEFTAIMGPSGSGKSTLMHIMAGLDTPSEGRAWIGDTEITGLGDLDLTILRRRRVGFIFQAFNLVPTLTAIENVLLACDYAGIKGPDAKAAAAEALGLVGLAERADHRPAELSGGEQQRVAIARALVNKPSLILADEPTGNLDSERSAEVLALLRRFNQEHGQTFILVTHDPEVAEACDRVVRMRDGRVRDQALATVPQAISEAVA